MQFGEHLDKVLESSNLNLDRNDSHDHLVASINRGNVRDQGTVNRISKSLMSLSVVSNEGAFKNQLELLLKICRSKDSQWFIPFRQRYTLVVQDLHKSLLDLVVYRSFMQGALPAHVREAVSSTNLSDVDIKLKLVALVKKTFDERNTLVNERMEASWGAFLNALKKQVKSIGKKVPADDWQKVLLLADNHKESIAGAKRLSRWRRYVISAVLFIVSISCLAALAFLYGLAGEITLVHFASLTAVMGVTMLCGFIYQYINYGALDKRLKLLSDIKPVSSERVSDEGNSPWMDISWQLENDSEIGSPTENTVPGGRDFAQILSDNANTRL